MSVESLSHQSITIENPSGTLNRYGKSGFSASTTALVRFERTYKTIKTDTKEREPIHALVGLEPDISISKGARVVYGSDSYRVMEIAEAVDGDGAVHHREAMLQLWSYT